MQQAAKKPAVMQHMVNLVQNQAFQYGMPSRKALIPFDEVEILKKEQLEFEQEIKVNRSKVMETVEEGYRSLIKEKLQVQHHEKNLVDFKVFIHCLKDIASADQNNKFPFKTTKDHLGIIFNRQF